MFAAAILRVTLRNPPFAHRRPSKNEQHPFGLRKTRHIPTIKKLMTSFGTWRPIVKKNSTDWNRRPISALMGCREQLTEVIKARGRSITWQTTKEMGMVVQ